MAVTFLFGLTRQCIPLSLSLSLSIPAPPLNVVISGLLIVMAAGQPIIQTITTPAIYILTASLLLTTQTEIQSHQSTPDLWLLFRY